MNRIFKRLSQGGSLNKPDTAIKFTFDGKTYSALAGDTLESAFLANNIFNHGRSKTGHILASASNLYHAITDICTDNGQYSVAMRDFSMVDGLKLTQTNKPRIQDKIRALSKILSPHIAIPEAIYPIHAHDITNTIINPNQTSEAVKKMTSNMIFNIEKSYFHTDVIFTSTNIFARQAALIYANMGLQVIMCHTQKDDAWHIFNQLELQILSQNLKNKIDSHPNIKILNVNDLALHHDKKGEKGQIIALNRAYSYGDNMPNTHHNHQNLQLLVLNARKIVFSPNLQEMGFLFQGHQLSAIMGCREYINLYLKFGLIPNKNMTLYVSNDMAYDVLSLGEITPSNVNAIIDIRPVKSPAMINAEKAGYKLYAGYVVTQASGKTSIESITFQSISGNKEGLVKSIECSLLLHSSGYDLDVSLLNSIPETIKTTVSSVEKIALKPDFKNIFSDQITMMGYDLCHNQGAKQDTISMSDLCHDFVKELNLQKNNEPDSACDTDISSKINWSCPEIYDVHRLCSKENIIFPQNIYYNDFIQLLYQHDTPEAILDTLKQDHNFCNNHWSIRVLLLQIQNIYNLKPQDIHNFYQKIILRLAKISFSDTDSIMNNISVASFPKPHIAPYYEIHQMDKFDNIITPDCAMQASQIHNYYNTIKSSAGIRSFNNYDIFDISGPDSLDFLEKFLDNIDESSTLKTVEVGKHYFINNERHKNPPLIIRCGTHKFCLITPKTAKTTQSIQSFYNTNRQLRVILNAIHQSWSYIQLVGAQAQSVFETLIKMKLVSIPKNTPNLWIENIQLRFAHYERYDIPHIDLLISSDAAAAFYHKLTQEQFQLPPFSEPIYNMIALEAGAIFDKPFDCDIMKQHQELFTTQALAIALAVQETSLEGGTVHQDKISHHNENPEGILLSTKIFSPYHDQYVVPTLLKGDFTQWENKIVSVLSKDKKRKMQVKIISDKMSKIQEVA
ncbi:MAG: hypothetical protein ACJARD_000691 [Alphaproteobacteria bacterium]|jgi:hypothetical protein